VSYVALQTFEHFWAAEFRAVHGPCKQLSENFSFALLPNQAILRVLRQPCTLSENRLILAEVDASFFRRLTSSLSQLKSAVNTLLGRKGKQGAAVGAGDNGSGAESDS
jgi:hypothetical protein